MKLQKESKDLRRKERRLSFKIPSKQNLGFEIKFLTDRSKHQDRKQRNKEGKRLGGGTPPLFLKQYPYTRYCAENWKEMKRQK